MIEQVLAGDRESFAGLVRAHHSKVLSLCYSLLSQNALAEDAAQEIFIKAFRSLSSFQKKSKFSTWLYQIAYRHCMDLLRERARERTDSLDALIEAKGERIRGVLTAPSNFEVSVEDKDLIDRVLLSLGPEYRMVLTLREMQGLTYEEISHVMDCSLDSVKARLRRARQQIQENMRHLLPPEGVQIGEGQHGQ